MTPKEREMFKELQRSILFQANVIKKFGDELLYFQKQEANVRYEIKLKRYREEILELKKS